MAAKQNKALLIAKWGVGLIILTILIMGGRFVFKQYKKYHEGKMYEIIERRYAIFPQESGQLTISPPVLTGHKITTNTQQTGSIYNQLARLSTKPVRYQADTITLEVKPQPQNFPSKHWLPAKDIKIDEE